jgi:hypothetical protein
MSTMLLRYAGCTKAKDHGIQLDSEFNKTANTQSNFPSKSPTKYNNFPVYYPDVYL